MNASDARYALWLLLASTLLAGAAGLDAAAPQGLTGLPFAWLPPLTGNGWIDLFARFQQSDGFPADGIGMLVDDFKSMYVWHWLAYAELALACVVFFVPWLVLRVFDRVPEGCATPLAALFLTGTLYAALHTPLPWLESAAPLLAARLVFWRWVLPAGMALVHVWLALTLLRRSGIWQMPPLVSTPSLRVHARLALGLGLAAALYRMSGLPWMDMHATEAMDAAVFFAAATLAWRLPSLTLAALALLQACAAAFMFLAFGLHIATVLFWAASLAVLAALLVQTHHILYGAGTPT